MNRSDTIFALSSGKLPAGIAVFRVSGSRTRFVIETIAGSVPPDRVMRRTVLKDLDGQTIDSGLCVYFPPPRSFTGEESAEFHVHGSLAVARRLSGVLADLPGVRPAEAGEFTQRAFLNGKLDLAEAEGLSDLIASETEAQRRLALQQSEGRLSLVYAGWRERLVRCRAMVEAAIDFSEEDDVAAAALMAACGEVGLLCEDIGNWLIRSASSEIVRDGYRVVIIGAPNAGKSSLLNALAGREAAIITDEPGTTRDLIDVRLELGDSLVIVTDTAGIRSAAGVVESIGIERAIKRARDADLVVLLQDAAEPVDLGLDLGPTPVIRVGNKLDLGVTNPEEYDLLVSAKLGTGIEVFTETIRNAAEAAVGNGELLIVQERQKELLASCVSSLEQCLRAQRDPDLMAEHLRLATEAIGRLTGHVDVEELLGVIFSRFCIGK